MDLTAITTRDDFLLEVGEALGGQASVRPVDSIAAALEYLTSTKRGQVLVIDTRDLLDVRADVDQAHAQAAHAVVIAFVTAETEKHVGTALKGSNVFAVLPIPLDKRKTGAVLDGAMTEETPYAPSSKKGAVRAELATTLMDQVKAGNLRAMIARAADFYGPHTAHGVPNVLVFEAFAKGGTASWLISDKLPHSLTFTSDAARGVAMLAERESAWNQVWHLPTTPEPPTGKAFIEMVAAQFGVPAKYRVLSRPVLRIVGLFNPDVRESYEMLYQSDAPYIFDSSKFAAEFGFAGTPYPEGIRITADSYRRT